MPEQVTQAEVERLRGLLERATPGLWDVAGTRHSGDLKLGRDARLHAVGPDGDAVAMVFYDMKTGRGLADAKLIAALKNAAPALLSAADELSRMREAVVKAENWLRACSDWLLANDLDMKMPSGPDSILEVDPLDIADELAALAQPPSAKEPNQ